MDAGLWTQCTATKEVRVSRAALCVANGLLLPKFHLNIPRWPTSAIRNFLRKQEDFSRSEEDDPEQYDENYLSDLSPQIGKPLELPTKKTACNYLDIYFSTIHIAYLFRGKPTVLHHPPSLSILEIRIFNASANSPLSY